MIPSGKKKENCLTVKQLNTANKNIFIASRTLMSTKTKYLLHLILMYTARFCKVTVVSKNIDTHTPAKFLFKRIDLLPEFS